MLAYCREHLNEDSTVAFSTRLQRQCDKVEMDQEVILALVSLLVHLRGRAGFKLQASAASIPRNSFAGSLAVSSLTDVNVDDLDLVEMSTYLAGDSDGQLWIYFTTLARTLTADQRELSCWTWLLKISLYSTLSRHFRPGLSRVTAPTGQTGEVRYLQPLISSR
jgi:hypothetical protein